MDSVPRVTTFDAALTKAQDRAKNPYSKEALAYVLDRAKTETDYKQFVPTHDAIGKSISTFYNNTNEYMCLYTHCWHIYLNIPFKNTKTT